MSEETSATEVDPLSLFPEQWRLPVEGLMYLGQLTDQAEFCGHVFGLRTLLPQDKFAVANAVQPYRNTLAEVDAYQAAHVGMALTSIDHDDDFCPAVGPDIDGFARARLHWVSKRFFPPTVEFLWTRLALLETTAEQAIAELDRLQKGSQPTTLPPWLDSLTAPGTSPDEIDSDTPPFTPSN